MSTTSEFVSRDRLSDLSTPESTKSHCPLSHQECVDNIHRRINYLGWKIETESYELTHDSNRMFGFIGVNPFDSPTSTSRSGYRFGIGFRNSHDKTFSFGLALGKSVLVCSNLCFSGEFTSHRKHTVNIRRDLAPMVNDAFGLIAKQMYIQKRRTEHMRQLETSNTQVNDFLVKSMQRGVISATQLPKVLEQWHTPNHPEFKDSTVWSLENAYTEVFKGNSTFVTQQRSNRLTEMLDRYYMRNVDFMSMN